MTPDGGIQPHETERGQSVLQAALSQIDGQKYPHGALPLIRGRFVPFFEGSYRALVQELMRTFAGLDQNGAAVLGLNADVALPDEQRGWIATIRSTPAMTEALRERKEIVHSIFDARADELAADAQQQIAPGVLTSPIFREQATGTTCVAATFLSAWETLTGMRIEEGEFVRLAKAAGFGVEDTNTISFDVFAAFTTDAFHAAFPSLHVAVNEYVGLDPLSIQQIAGQHAVPLPTSEHTRYAESGTLCYPNLSLRDNMVHVVGLSSLDTEHAVVQDPLLSFPNHNMERARFLRLAMRAGLRGMLVSYVRE